MCVVVFGFPIVVTDTPNNLIGVNANFEGGDLPPVPFTFAFGTFFGVVPQYSADSGAVAKQRVHFDFLS
jgi:hypothetical protein